jgi:hypothetical protein
MNYPPYPLRGILYQIEQVRANQNQEGDRVYIVGKWYVYKVIQKTSHMGKWSLYLQKVLCIGIITLTANTDVSLPLMVNSL